MNKRTGPWKTIKSGNVGIPIYRTANPKAADGYEFKVAYYVRDGDDNKRRLKTFTDGAKAEKFANDLNATINKGDAHTLVLAGDELHAYQEATNVIHETGKTLIQAAHEYADAIKKLNGIPLAVAIDGYYRTHAKMERKGIQAIVDELIEAKRTNKRKPASEVYLADMRLRLDKFANSFHVNIDEVTGPQIEEYLANIKGSGRTQFNCGRLVRTLFNFAEKRHYLPKDSNPFEKIDLTFEDVGVIEIFTPEEMRKLLKAARRELIPFLALGGFAGLRNKEIQRLDWSNIVGNEIRIHAAQAKTRQSRIIEMQPNLIKWLEPHRQKSGAVVDFVHVNQQLDWLSEDAGVKWKRNGLRHSFCSNCYALHGAKQTSIWAGHSEDRLFKNYRALLNEDAAREWFSILPS
jgi:integrase